MKLRERFNSADLAELIDAEKSEADLLNDLVRDFSTSYEATLDDMESAHNEGRFRDLKLSAHSLKSTARLLGLRTTGYLCQRIENDAREGKFDPRNLMQLREEIRPAVLELKAFILERNS